MKSSVFEMVHSSADATGQDLKLCGAHALEIWCSKCVHGHYESNIL